MRKRFRPFGTHNNVVGPVVAVNLIEKEFKLVGGDLGGRLARMLFKKLYMTKIMILGMWSIAWKFHFEDHLLKMRGKRLGVLRHKKSSFLNY